MPTLRRATTVTLAATATLALAASAVVLLGPRTGTPVARPAPDATPEQVVDAYTRALAAGDCDTVRALRTHEAGSSSWCADLASLTDVQVADHVVQDPAWSGRSSDQDVVYVPVTFDLDWRAFHNDGSMAEGPATWGYVLSRAGADEPWQVLDEGVG